MRLYAAGDNAFGQISSSTQDVYTTTPHLISDNVRRVVHVTQSQCIYETQDGYNVIVGLPMEYKLHFQSVKALLGKDEVSAYIDDQDQLCLLNGTVLETGCSTAAMDSHGHLCLYRRHQGEKPKLALGWRADVAHLVWMPGVGASDVRSWLEPANEAREIYICAGASHFIVVSTQPPNISTVGSDNRFGQLSSNTNSQQGAERCKVEFFTKDMTIFPRCGQIAAGELHCAAVDSSTSALYMWGDDTKGQTGGSADGGYPALVELPDEADVSFVACGAHHTAVVAGGKAFVTGANDYGQLGLGDTESRSAFTPCTFFDGSNAAEVHCGRYTTYWLLYD